MSKDLVTQQYSPEELKLITEVVAKNATPEELKMFLYRCKLMGLNPLKPGHVHFVKYKNRKTGEWGPGTIIIGIDGFRSRAAATGKHSGTKRGVLRDEKNKCFGAWAEVYRRDWSHPAREEVSLAEYNTGYEMWARMPETMIKKVAEVAALRMAFADDLGGMYSDDEMAQATPREELERAETSKLTADEQVDRYVGVSPNAIKEVGTGKVIAQFTSDDAEGRDYLVTFGKWKGKRLGEIPANELVSYCEYILNEAALKNKGVLSGGAAKFIKNAEMLISLPINPSAEEPPF